MFLILALVAFGAHHVLNAASNLESTRFGAKWRVLEGLWEGENQPGGASGACGFRFDLADHILIRTNSAKLAGSAAVVHDDLMVITPDISTDKAKAMYYDNEGHVIQYDAEWSQDGNVLIFASKLGSGPQFRLTYKKLGTDEFLVSFGIAPPGASNSFKAYTSGKITRAKR